MVFNDKIPLFFKFMIMNHILSQPVKKFFEEYERNVNDSDPQCIASQYGDLVMIATPKGAYAFKNEDFLKMLPNRKQFFDKIGLKSPHIVSLEETEQGPYHFLVKAVWNFRFEKEPKKLFDIQASSTYILRKDGDLLRIIFQLDHEDLMERIS